ncbi:MAG: 4Fe-4S binding protein [Candidatus Methanoplasma sp.]|jgi:ferredoxin|nr:4Fe-4S binding protein [Candidatus Methanoplasma sp.]
MKVNLDKCLHCGGCVGSCPVNAIFLNDFVLEFSSKCTKCGRCVKICPVHALSMEGKK